MSSLINTESPLHTDALCVVVTLYCLALLMRFFVHVGCQLEVQVNRELVSCIVNLLLLYCT